MKLDIKTDVLDLDKVNREDDERIAGKKLPPERKVAPKAAKARTFGDLWRDEKQASLKEKPFQFKDLGSSMKMRDAFKT